MRLGTLLTFSLLGACLSERGRVADDDATTTTTTTSPTTTDATSSDVSNPDVQCSDCDDGDECTYDFCDNGVCQHSPIAVPAAEAAIALPECDTNDDCPQYDNCTQAVCVVTDPEGCGGWRGYCSYEPIPGCGSCAGGCDDGNACTVDSCGADGTCEHELDPDCNTSCNSDGLVPLSTAVYGGAYDLKTVGMIVPSPQELTCDDGPTCDCVGFPALSADNLALNLVQGEPDDAGDVESPWECRTRGCLEQNTTIECAPMVAGGTYRVWGTGIYYLPPAGEAPPGDRDPITPINGVEVRGFCLDTAPTSLDGTYTASIFVAPKLVTFTVELTAVDQGVIVEMKDPKCNACESWATSVFPQSTVIEEGDGQIGFEMQMPTPNGPINGHAQLYSHRNYFSGKARSQDGSAMQVVLERVGNPYPTLAPH